MSPRVLLLSALLLSGPVFAQEVDEAALAQTAAMLKDPSARKAAVEKDARAREADAHAQRVAGNPANTEEMYALAAEIFETLSREAGGDPEKMNQLLAAAMANPEAFAGKLTPEQRAKLKALSEKVPKAQ